MPVERRFWQVVSGTATAAIAASATTSGAIDLYGLQMVALGMPTYWTAGVLTFNVSIDGSTYLRMYKNGAEYFETVTASQFIVLTPADFAGVRYVQLRSGTYATPVTQTAARSIELVVRSV